MRFCDALADVDYRFGAVVIDAALFVPQSRERVFIVAIDADAHIPAELAADVPTAPFHSSAIIAACQRQRNPIWWRLPVPPKRNTTLADIIEDAPTGVPWHTEAGTRQLLEATSPANRMKLEAAKAAGRRIAGTAFRRMRDVDGRRMSRTELRFDGIAGCLRVPTGGSSRQFVIVAENGEIRSRLLSPREATRLMGLPEDYRLPANMNEALAIAGDGVVVSVVRFLAGHILQPVLQASARSAVTDHSLSSLQR